MGDTGRPPVADGARAAAADTGRTPVVDAGAGTGRRRRTPDASGGRGAPYGAPRGPGAFPGRGAPAQGAPGYGAPAAQGAPAHGGPAHGSQGYGSQGRGPQEYGTPAHGVPGHGGGAFDTPAHGVPHTPAHGIPVRGGHPAHEEGGRPAPERYGAATGGARTVPGPRRTAAAPPAGPDAPTAGAGGEDAVPGRGGKGKALTGVAAAAVTTCLAIVVAGQVADRGDGAPAARAAQEPAERVTEDSASRSDERAAPSRPSAVPTRQAAPTYEQLMTHQFPIDPKLAGSGEFEAVAGLDKAPGAGRKYRYRVDVEKGLGLDARLFARAVQQTLNDKRSWAGRGAMTFERISSGEPDFVITLASPVTTGKWCAKSGLDTTIDNVSCDSASTERVMINAFRWAQGSETFGPKAMHAYRQMLINHEVGHRLGHNHVSCRTPGALAPVMQQQTKSLEIDGIACRPNPWVHPGS
ncbi:hypothetical protein GCM10010363_11250 [Streptomyces omiyaensis]|uniref:DUF3152 domain-containing protein n=1 Tax=Streptomyces omiyaensis TaxID=68247 RepID=UPI0019A1CD68|nr:DUF3152 domain-containing protein [Streptomyces omiyaensis]GGY32428.1 hypothetical protein GCM10010363_11250 [Streptomyces omiyaensis]